MDSRIFIRNATNLIADIAAFQAANLSAEDAQVQGSALQKDITAAFSGLQNPSLPSAEKLRDVALAAGFAVKPNVIQNIDFEVRRCWSN